MQKTQGLSLEKSLDRKTEYSMAEAYTHERHLNKDAKESENNPTHILEEGQNGRQLGVGPSEGQKNKHIFTGKNKSR